MNNKKPASLRNYKISIPTNSQETVVIEGKTVRLLNANVPISFISEDGMLAFELSSGDEAVFDDAIFYRFRLFHSDPATQLITIAVGNGGRIGSAKLNGVVTVSGALALDAPTLAALESTDLNATTRDLLRFQNYATSYNSNTIMAANAPQTIFTPAANVNGAIIHSAMNLSYGVSIHGVILAKATAPTSVVDGEIIAMNHGHNNVGTLNALALNQPIKIAAGKGLYRISNVAEVIALASVLYTLL